MRSADEIKLLAYERLEEAKILADNAKYDGAFYLAGYSLELMLKAKMCERLGIDNLFNTEDRDSPTNNIHGAGKVREALKTHDISVLLIFSGLKNKLDREKSQNSKLMQTTALLFEGSGKCNWSEQSRYKPCGSQNANVVRNLISLLKDEEGLLKWIEKN